MIEYRVRLHPIYRCEKCNSVLKRGFHRSIDMVSWTCDKCGHMQVERDMPDRYITLGEFKNELSKNS